MRRGNAEEKWVSSRAEAQLYNIYLCLCRWVPATPAGLITTVKINKRLEIKAGMKLETCSLNSNEPSTASIQSGRKTTITVPMKAPKILRMPPSTAAVKRVSDSETG